MVHIYAFLQATFAQARQLNHFNGLPYLRFSQEKGACTFFKMWHAGEIDVWFLHPLRDFTCVGSPARSQNSVFSAGGGNRCVSRTHRCKPSLKARTHYLKIDTRRVLGFDLADSAPVTECCVTRVTSRARSHNPPCSCRP